MTGSKSTIMKNQPEIIIIPVEDILGYKSLCKSSKPTFLNKQFAHNNLSDGRKKAEARNNLSDGRNEARNNLSDGRKKAEARNNFSDGRKKAEACNNFLDVRKKADHAHESQHEVIVYADDKTLYALDNLKEKLSTTMGCRKRGPPDLGNVGKKKREKLSWWFPERLDEKQQLMKQLSEVARGNNPPCMQRSLKESAINCGKKEGTIKLDKDIVVEEILSKLEDKVRFKRAGERLEKQWHESEKKREQEREAQRKKLREQKREAERKKLREKEREAERKRQRERDREAAHLALEQIGKTVEFDDNMQTMKDFFMLIGCPISKQYGSFEGQQWSHLWDEFEEGEIRE